MSLTHQIVNDDNGTVLFEDTIETEEGFFCNECDEAIEVDEDDPIYECQNCSNVFFRSESNNYNHQCPECNKFASKLADFGCSDCKPGDVEKTELAVCPRCLNRYPVMDSFGDHFGGCNG